MDRSDLTILLVDDEPDIRDAFSLYLSHIGYSVVSAANGEAALSRFRTTRPSIVLSDIKMPGMDGIELLREVKRENPDTEVIMITGHGDMDLAITCLQLDAADFITKPFGAEALEAALKRAEQKISMKRQIRDYTNNLESLVAEKTVRMIEAGRSDAVDKGGLELTPPMQGPQIQELSTDITRIRRLQGLTSLGFLIGSISHGIKGMLTGMDAAVYLLESGFRKQDPVRVEEGLEVVKRMVERIRNLVSSILYDSKKRELNWSEAEVRKLANDAACIVEPKIGKRSIALIRDFREPLGSFEVDEGAFRSALINLLENAVEACAEDKAGKDSYRIVFTVRQESDSILFVVSDNGMGMDKRTRENLFNLFFSSKGQSGTGLGLFIVNKIVLQHGGSIRVVSESGQGASFTIRMPKILPTQVRSASMDCSLEAPRENGQRHQKEVRDQSLASGDKVV